MTSGKQPRERTVVFYPSGYPIDDLALRHEFEAANVVIAREHPPESLRRPVITSNGTGYAGVRAIMAYVRAS